MRRWSCSALALLISVFGPLGCLSDFDAFSVVDDSDAGQQDGDLDDGGIPDPDNPIQLGRDCENPHLAVALASSSDAAQLRHYNFNGDGTLEECHESDLAREQGAFGGGVNAVAMLPDGHEIIAVNYAVLGLDGRGFPIWRWQLWDNDASNYDQTEIFPLRVAGSRYIGVLHCNGSCSWGANAMMILDEDGFEVHHIDELPRVGTTMAAAAPHPDGSDRVVLASTYDPLEVHVLDTSTVDMSDWEGADLSEFGEFDIPDVGSLESLESDVETGHLVLTYNNAVFVWHYDDPVPTPAQGLDCVSISSYKNSALDPTTDNAVYAVASGEGGTHLYRLQGSECQVIIDATTLGSLRLTDVALVRGTLE